MNDKSLVNVKEKEFYETSVQGYWDKQTPIVCSDNLLCSDYLIVDSMEDLNV